MQFTRPGLGMRDEDRSKDPNYRMQSGKQRARSGENAVSTFLSGKDPHYTQACGYKKKTYLRVYF